MMHFHPTHVGLQRLRNAHRAVGLLVVFQHGHQRAAHGQTGAVQRVHMLGLRLALAALAPGIGRAEARLHPPGLESLGIRNEQDLPTQIGRASCRERV